MHRGKIRQELDLFRAVVTCVCLHNPVHRLGTQDQRAALLEIIDDFTPTERQERAFDKVRIERQRAQDGQR